MSRDHTITGERYIDCDLCGFTYRWSETVLNTAGLRVCRNHDVDKGEYRFAPVPPYDINSPVYYDSVMDQYFQLQSQNQVLVAVPIPHLGGFLPQPYLVADFANNKSYQLIINNGQMSIQSGVDGKKVPLLVDTEDGSLQQIQVQNVAGNIQLILVGIT